MNQTGVRSTGSPRHARKKRKSASAAATPVTLPTLPPGVCGCPGGGWGVRLLLPLRTLRGLSVLRRRRCPAPSNPRPRGSAGVRAGVEVTGATARVDCLSHISHSGVARSDLEAEQAYVDHAHGCLEATRRRVREFWERVAAGREGNHAARFERDVLEHRVFQRLGQLELGGRSLCFGRIDLPGPAAGDDGPDGTETFYIGRIGVWDEEQAAVVCDWRAPVAAPFFRATGRQPLGLARRRRFVSRGSRLLGLDDEHFSPGGLAPTAAGADSALRADPALQAALEAPRTGRIGDATATIQSEQDDVIRAPLAGVLIVQGGPGTGKTVVALHRAAYLIYTHRFPLAGQGVLVIGPNPVFLTYVEQVLPSLGEAGVRLATLGDLLDDLPVGGHDAEPVARTKGDARMATVLRRAVRTRQRALPAPLVLDYGLRRLRLSTEQSAAIVAAARRRARTHNAGRRLVESAFFEALATSPRRPADPAEVAEALAGTSEVRRALDWMWPQLTPAHLLHDLFGSRALLANAAAGVLDGTETEGLYRPRRAHADDVTWTVDDVPLLDEARKLLGPGRRRGGAGRIRTYGHIVVDEAQDLSPMQLRMVGRRSLNGSLTLVGDIAQATSAWAHDSWDSLVDLVAPEAPPRFAELTIGYRVPQPIMSFASACLPPELSHLVPPRAARAGGEPPRIVRLAEAGPAPLAAAVTDAVRRELPKVGAGNLAVICADEQVAELSGALSAAGVAHGTSDRRALGMQVSVCSARTLKGLEVDAAVVVEPGRIAGGSAAGMRLLYVALSRATRRLTVICGESLPESLEAAASKLGA
ncbi:MAG: AAA family ATPase [Acidimicrobiia bacterium]|nr:AAA family ATPase [Acidimicrobiia bacterium]